jgi:hypothetical protein
VHTSCSFGSSIVQLAETKLALRLSGIVFVTARQHGSPTTFNQQYLINNAGPIMRLIQTSLMCGIIALAALANPAAARVRVGVVIGVPGPWYAYPRYYDHYDPYYYPPRYYYPYPPVVAVPVPTAPPTYVQQPYAQQPDAQQANDQPPQAENNNDWYYCAAQKAYYPYVKQCPSGWTRVAPKPQGAP